MDPLSHDPDATKVIGDYAYEVKKCLGEGSFGKVYLGRHAPTGQKVAIKKVDLKLLENNAYLQRALNTEISILKRFNHPNIVRFIDFLQTKNNLYIIMEYCELGDLKRYMRKNKLTPGDILNIVKQVVVGFYQLHRENVTHRDLKPANILVSTQNGYAAHTKINNDNSNNCSAPKYTYFKIADFGLARYVGDVKRQVLMSCVGSPNYMAPQILMHQPYTAKSDIWSLGIILYELAFGQPPWIGANDKQVLAAIQSRPIQIPEEGELFTMMRLMLEFDEEKRVHWKQLYRWAGIIQIQSQALNSTSNNSNVQVWKASPTSPNNKNMIYPKSPPSASSTNKNSNNHQLLHTHSNINLNAVRQPEMKDVEKYEQLQLVQYIVMDFFSRQIDIRHELDCEAEVFEQMLVLLRMHLIRKADASEVVGFLLKGCYQLAEDIQNYLQSSPNAKRIKKYMSESATLNAQSVLDSLDALIQHADPQMRFLGKLDKLIQAFFKGWDSVSLLQQLSVRQ